MVTATPFAEKRRINARWTLIQCANIALTLPKEKMLITLSLVENVRTKKRLELKKPFAEKSISLVLSSSRDLFFVTAASLLLAI